MRNWLTRWDVSPAEQAGMSFGQVLTVVNLRRVEVACLLELFAKGVELAIGAGSTLVVIEMVVTVGCLLASLVLRRHDTPWLARGLVALVIIGALLFRQWGTVALGAQGRLTSGYPLMLLSLTLLFIVPPRILALATMTLFVSYCGIVVATPTLPAEKVVAIVNTAIVSLIAIIAAALIHSGRRRDYDQRAAIRLQNDQLRDRNDELDALMAITAHDLRSPLFGLRNLFDLAARRAAQEPELPLVVLRQAMASIDAMLALATSLLDAHAAEHRPLTCLVDEDVRGHILAAANRIGPLAQSADVRIGLDLPDRPVVATFDSAALAQILDNLLSNGVRYSPAGGTVTIAAARKNLQVTITVQDQGPGIDPAGRDMLFKKFHRGAGAQPDDLPGTGMGLFIVATLAARMDASVRCETVTRGGSAFIVSLPSAVTDKAPPKRDQIAIEFDRPLGHFSHASEERTMTETVMTRDDFLPHVATDFALVGAEPPFTLSLTEAAALRHADPARRAPFSLLFKNADPRQLEQALYRLEHPAIGEIDIFLVPIARDATGATYEAVFN